MRKRLQGSCLLAQRVPCLSTLHPFFSASLVTRHWCLVQLVQQKLATEQNLARLQH